MTSSLQYEFTERALGALRAEGAYTHTGPLQTYPTLPGVGDCMSFDWLLGGRLFVVVSRVFIWRSDSESSVMLMLDLAETGQSENGT
ncbi:MAG: hypothetical protein EOP02_29815 [Proteobacteria bacterium]|nr:MAG: hypothetical protein EOP02_29815 [Pseudomonadota bacterium]